MSKRKKSRAADVAGKVGKPPRPRGVDGSGDTVRVGLLLRTDQVAAVDSLRVTMRATTGAAVQRSPLVRAVLDAVLASGVDLTGCEAEADVRAAVAEALGE